MTDLPLENRSDAVPWMDIVRFVRQLSHDLRNHLNAAELQAAYIGELAESEELKKEVGRLRELMAQVATSLQRVTTGLAPIHPTFMSYPAADFFEDLKKKTDSTGEPGKIIWESEAGDAILNIDPQLLQQALMELFANAFQHEPGIGALIAKAYVEDGKFTFTLREPKARFELSTENWGREPLRMVNRGHYGLGLSRVRAIVQAHGGEFSARYDPGSSALLTTLRLPLATKETPG
jgi:signal transduction histidine kinase